MSRVFIFIRMARNLNIRNDWLPLTVSMNPYPYLRKKLCRILRGLRGPVTSNDILCGNFVSKHNYIHWKFISDNFPSIIICVPYNDYRVDIFSLFSISWVLWENCVCWPRVMSWIIELEALIILFLLSISLLYMINLLLYI